jgi:hypothetical protein
MVKIVLIKWISEMFEVRTIIPVFKIQRPYQFSYAQGDHVNVLIEYC